MQSYYRSGALTVDTSHTHKFFQEADKNTTLDDNVMDHSALDSGLELSPPMADSRRESFAIGGSALFSPKTEDWQSVDMQSVPSNNPFLDQHSNNPFLRLDHAQAYGVQSAWPMDHSAAVPAGLQHFDAVQSDYDANASIFQQSMQGQAPFSTAANIFGALGPATHSIPASPQKEWMASNQGMNKKMRPSSPAIRSHNDLRRGDGIRKKNARFDIPAERNLTNIDQLISQSTDDQEIKELKQQKRLLRNRQAALDSRQRKKLHTERLEDEKKHFTVVMADLEDEVVSLKAKMEQLMIEKQSFVDYIDRMTMEKDEMIRAHTIETGELRKRLGVLTEHVQRYENNPAPATISGASAFTGGFGNIDGMPMGGVWDDSGLVNEYPTEQEPPKQQQMSLMPIKSEDEKGAAQGGLLFMLFLVGAFVMSSRSTPAIPRVSEDVRAASATLLNNVLKDAGVNAHGTGVQALAPQPSSSAWMDASGMHMNDMNVDHVAPSMLSELGNSLTQPSEEQTHEQIFSLSAAQYNGISDQDFLQTAPGRSTSQGRKNLGEALAAMRASNKQNGAADVYTRSLLWDQVPTEVVRNLAKMFADCNTAQNEQQCNDARS